jgi:hypothetical protein
MEQHTEMSKHAWLEAGLSSAIPQSLPSASGVARREGKAPVEDVGASGPHPEGKAPAESSSMVSSATEPHGFMADAQRPMAAQAPPAVEEGWQVVSCYKQWCWVACTRPSPCADGFGRPLLQLPSRGSRCGGLQVPIALPTLSLRRPSCPLLQAPQVAGRCGATTKTPPPCLWKAVKAHLGGGHQP